MSYRVKLKPSGHEFETEAQETVLQAGLRAGLNLNYRCDNGSCGSCRARLIGGQLSAQGYQDFRLTEAEKSQGEFLMCCQRPASDCVIEAGEVGDVTEIPGQCIQAKVSKVERLQEEFILLQVRTPRSQGLRFLAGQSVALCFEGLAPMVLPIASCPCDALHLRFHIRYHAGDPASEFVFNTLKKGMGVGLEGPLGDFSLNENSSRPLLFVAAECGFAPIESLIDHALQLDPDRRIHLYWLSAIPRGHYLSNYCRAWVDALDDFHYHSIDLAPVGDWQLETLYAHIQRSRAPLEHWDHYLALTPEMRDFAQIFLQRAGVPDTQLRMADLPRC